MLARSCRSAEGLEGARARLKPLPLLGQNVLGLLHLAHLWCVEGRGIGDTEAGPLGRTAPTRWALSSSVARSLEHSPP
eukprot:scaffold12289_cov24-Phaeocystis_antarctica.AAC.1